MSLMNNDVWPPTNAKTQIPFIKIIGLNLHLSRLNREIFLGVFQQTVIDIHILKSTWRPTKKIIISSLL